MRAKDIQTDTHTDTHMTTTICFWGSAHRGITTMNLYAQYLYCITAWSSVQVTFSAFFLYMYTKNVVGYFCWSWVRVHTTKTKIAGSTALLGVASNGPEI